MDALKGLFWKKEQEIERLKHELRGEEGRRQGLLDRMSECELRAEQAEGREKEFVEGVERTCGLLEKIAGLNQRIIFETNRSQTLSARCTELQERSRTLAERNQELQIEVGELQKLREMSDKKAGADNIRLSKMVSDLQERYSAALAQCEEQKTAHAAELERLQSEIEQHVMHGGTSNARGGGDAIQMYRAKLLAQQEEIRTLKEAAAAQNAGGSSSATTRMRQDMGRGRSVSSESRPGGGGGGGAMGKPAASSAPLKSLKLFPQHESLGGSMERTSTYGSLLGSSPEEDRNQSLVPRRLPRKTESKRPRKS